MMKYTVRPLYIREAIIYGDLQNFEAVKWNQIQQNKKDGRDGSGVGKRGDKNAPFCNDVDGKETLGDAILNESLWCKDFDFPKLPTFKCLICSNDLYEDYSNFKDFEEVDDFLINNGSDWQEGGLYNAAHIVKQNEDSNIVEEMFYSVATRSFVEMKICTGHYYHLTQAHIRLYEQKKFDITKVVFHKKEVKKYSWI